MAVAEVLQSGYHVDLRVALFVAVGRPGFEPGTTGLKGHCATLAPASRMERCALCFRVASAVGPARNPPASGGR